MCNFLELTIKFSGFDCISSLYLPPSALEKSFTLNKLKTVKWQIITFLKDGNEPAVGTGSSKRCGKPGRSFLNPDLRLSDPELDGA